MKRLLCTLGLAALLGGLGGCGDDYIAKPAMDESLIVLGIDGMDPVLLRQYIDEGRVPNLARIAEQGSFIPLGTTDPPQSPVAWSAFITGLGLGGHGIYDFVHRDPIHLEPYLSTSRTGAPETVLGFEVSGGEPELLRDGEAFWQTLEKHQVAAVATKIPANYPPARSRMNESSSGMGTPDLMGGYGTFQLFTSDAELAEKHMSAGILHHVDFGDGQVGRAELEGPTGAEGLDLEVARDMEHQQAVIRVGGENVLLRAGEWSEWTPLEFSAGAVSSMPGMVRFHLRSVEPLHLYVSPINADPTDAALPISEPPSFAEEMARDIGRFYTQGMAEDTKALSGGALSDEEFLAQADIVFSERVRMLEREMERYQGGLFFFYFSSIDQVGHMYYGSLVESSLPKYREYDWVYPKLYEKMDRVIGKVLEWAGDRPVVIMSDHGFGPYRYKVNLNSWLARQGYLAVLPPDQYGEGILGHIDWENTQAYALGLNQLFLNVEGREARGVVPDSEREVLVARIVRDLESWRHEGERVVTKAMKPEVGTFGERAPDLIVGYNRGYRSSDSSAQGAVGNEVITVNTDHWNGDHCVHASHVPGVLLSTMPLGVEEASLVDLAPSILDYFGVERPDDVAGKVIWDSTE